MAETRVLIVARTDESVRQLRKILENISGFVVVGDETNSQKVINAVQKWNPKICIVESDVLPDRGLHVIQELSQQARSPKVLLVLKDTEVELLRKALLYGLVRGYVFKPDIDERELISTLKTFETIPDERTDHKRVYGKMIAVVSGKGGVGKTLIATSIAKLLGYRAPTVLLDLDLQYGDVEDYLNIKTQKNDVKEDRRSISSLIRVINELNEDTFDAALAETSIVSDKGYLKALRAPDSPSAANLFEASDIQALLEFAVGAYPLTIVDTSTNFDGVFQMVLRQADIVLTVTTPAKQSIRAAGKLRSEYSLLGYSDRKLHLIVNRVQSPKIIRTRKIGEKLKLPILCEIPESPAVVQELLTSSESIFKLTNEPLVRQINKLGSEIEQQVRIYR